MPKGINEGLPARMKSHHGGSSGEVGYGQTALYSTPKRGEHSLNSTYWGGKGRHAASSQNRI